MPNRGPENNWVHPQNLIGVLGILAMIWGGYVTFQKDTAKEIQDVAVHVADNTARIRVLESQVEDLRKK